MNKKYLSLASMMTLCFLLLLIGGCGSSSNKDSGSTGVTRVGETSCIVCHSSSAEKLTGYPIVANFMASIHNLNSVGCQDCHGAGAQHEGKGPIPYPSPNEAQCQSCHGSATAADGVAQAGAVDEAAGASYGLVNKYAASKHKLAETEDGRAKCNRCHTHQGAVLAAISNYTGDGNVIAAMVGAPGVIPNPEPIKCNTCHDTHNPRTLRVDTAWLPSATVGAATASANNQFRLCTQCHGYTNPAGQLMGSGTAASGTALASYHETSWYRIIGTTHYDNPATGYGLAKNMIEGYVLRHNGANPCFDCHGHEALTNTRAGTATIYTDWAKSAHASHLLTTKYAAAAANPINTTLSRTNPVRVAQGRAQVDAVMAAGPDQTSSWPHYDWDAASRQDCQRCHTSTGLVNFVAGPATYSAAKNDFRHMAGWTGAQAADGSFSNITSSRQNELLYCWGCHSNAATGAIRNPGAIKFTYTNNATVTYPNVSGSNVCVACHTGRETGDSIKNDSDADGVRSFLNSHYLAAGGQLFGTTGYEYAGLNYANPSYFAHDKIGSSAAPGTGTNGPCVGCHMKTDNSHLFTNVTKNATGAITAITSTACATCHTGNYALTPAKLTEEEEEYKDALEAAKAAMAGKGLYFLASYPYWHKDPAGGSANAFTNWAGVYGFAKWKDVMGAAFNVNLLIHDPGGYAHNRYYVKRLLWDSMDLITNGTLGDINMTATIDGLASLTAAQKAGAKKYLGAARP